MRGFLLSADAMIAAGLLLLIAVFVSGISFSNTYPEIEYERLYYSSRDSINVIESIRISEMRDFQIVQDYLDRGILTQHDLNKTLLDVLGALWALGNTSEAANLTKEVFDYLLNGTEIGYEVSIENTTIYSSKKPFTRVLARSPTIVSGFDIGEPVSGFVSRVFLTRVNKIGTEYVYFGGFVGQGNITRILNLPKFENIIEAYMEFDMGTNLTMYINGNYSGYYAKQTSGNLSADKFTISSSYYDSFVNGSNTIFLNFSEMVNASLRGGFIRVKYNTSELVTEDESFFGENASGRYNFPGVNGVINLFSSFYIPGNLNNLEARLHLKSQYPVFLNIENATVFSTNVSSEQIVILNDSYFSSIFSYSNLSEKTVPVRFGTEEVEVFFGGLTDTTLITDRTGSMSSCDVDISCGTPGICDSSSPCHERRYKVAHEADKQFVSAILNTTGNRVGLIGYGERSDPTCSYLDVTNDNQSIQDRIDDYTFGGSLQQCGWTCISCGVVGATVQLEENVLFTGFRKISDKNTTELHVGDSPTNAITETLNVNINKPNFLKSRLTIMGTNIDVESGYRDCIYLNGVYLGRICESNEVVSNGLHTCTYPLKSEWVNDGNNNVTITGGTVNGCFDTAGENDDWDFKDVELIVWETNDTAPDVTSYFSGNETVGGVSYNQTNRQYMDIWELQADLPYPVDFTSGYNTTANTFGLGGASEDDGWDWASDVYGFTGSCTFNGAVGGVLDIFNPAQDSSCAYGVQFEVTQEMLDNIANGSSVFVSFNYEWNGNDNPFESSDQVWIKGRVTLPNGTILWLGSDLDTGHSGSDSTPEIATEDNPDTDFTGVFLSNITDWVTQTGWYYLDFGGKLDRSGGNEWGYYRFDNIAVYTWNQSEQPLIDIWELQADLPYPVDFTSGYNTTANTFGLGGASEDDGWDWASDVYGFTGSCTFNGAVGGVLDIFNPAQDSSCAYGVQFEVTQEMLDNIANGSSVFVSFNYEWNGNDNPFESSDQVWIKGRVTLPNGTILWLGSDLDTGHSGSDSTPEIATEDNPDTDFSDSFFLNITSWVTQTGWYYLDFGGKLDRSASNEWGYYRFDNIAVGIPDVITYSPQSFTLTEPYNVTLNLNVSEIKEVHVSFEARDVDPSYYDCAFVNGNYIGRIEFQQWSGINQWQEIIFDVPVIWLEDGQNNFSFTGGTPYGCLRTGDNDQWNIRNVNITTISVNETSTYSRIRSMVIMSDGQANTKIGDCHNYGSGSCTVIGGAETPSDETVSKACNAHDKYGTRIFTIAFGDVGSQAIDTLNQTACCDSCDNFYTSNDADELLEIYQNIADTIINFSYQTQQLNFSGNANLNETLYSDSYIEYNYTSTLSAPGFGEVTFSLESPRFSSLTGNSTITDNASGTKEGWYVIPDNTEVLEARVTSYSSDFWTDRLYAKSESNNWTRVFWLGNYTLNYTSLGDPYIVNIPRNLVVSGENNSIRIGTGLSPGVATGGSPDDRVIYRLRVSGISLDGYSDVFPKADGSANTIYYDINGDNVSDGSIFVSVGPNPSDIFDPQNDSIDDAFMRLLDMLNFLFDFNSNAYGNGTVTNPYDGINISNPVDLQITSDMEFETGSISGIPTLWGPVTIEIRMWV